MPTRKPKRITEMRKINKVEIRLRLSDGYIDAAAICDAADRELSEYTELRMTRKFMAELSKETDLSESELLSVSEDGAWAHPRVAINLAQWASPKLAVKIPMWIIEWSVRKAGANAPQTPAASTSGVKFEDIDPAFTSLISRAASFDPGK